MHYLLLFVLMRLCGVRLVCRRMLEVDRALQALPGIAASHSTDAQLLQLVVDLWRSPRAGRSSSVTQHGESAGAHAQDSPPASHVRMTSSAVPLMSSLPMLTRRASLTR